tara:strand:+ start:2896 stop:3213 length:318 start_codon:yes stop_codon:yes gene_type:complete
MSEIAIVYTTFPDQESAEKVARAVVDQKLAACANVLGTSLAIYRWEGEVATEQEIPALFKAPVDRAEALRDRIVALHPYDLPAVESWPVTVGDEVMDWANAATGG